MQSLIDGTGAACGPANELKRLTGAADRDRSIAQDHRATSGIGPGEGFGSQAAGLPFRLNGQILQPEVRPAPVIFSSSGSDFRNAWNAASALPERERHRKQELLPAAPPVTVTGRGKQQADDHAWRQEYMAQNESAQSILAQNLSGRLGSLDNPRLGLCSPTSGGHFNQVPFSGVRSRPQPWIPTTHHEARHLAFPTHPIMKSSHEASLGSSQPSHLAQTAREILDLGTIQEGWDEADRQASLDKVQQSGFFSMLDRIAVPKSTPQYEEASPGPESLIKEFQTALTMLEPSDGRAVLEEDWVAERETIYPCFPTVHRLRSEGAMSSGWIHRTVPTSQGQSGLPTDRPNAPETVPDFDQEIFQGFYESLSQEDHPITGSALQSHLDLQTTGLNMSLNLMLDGLDELDGIVASEERERGYTRAKAREDHLEYLLPGDARRTQNLQHDIADIEEELLVDGSNQHAWFRLGQAQQANERDKRAIAAFRHCLSLDPDFASAYLGLAVSFTNEGDLSSAHRALENWLDLAQEPAGLEEATSRKREGRDRRHDALVRALITRITANHASAPADLQVAFGILLNSSEEHKKAADCFRSALLARPEDPRIINMLGATLANGDSPREALECYRLALDLDPGYIRALFNSGVSYIKLSEYNQAIAFLVDALRLQSTGVEGTTWIPRSRDEATSNIWATLESACLHLGHFDLISASRSRSLAAVEAAMAINDREDNGLVTVVANQN